MNTPNDQYIEQQANALMNELNQGADLTYQEVSLYLPEGKCIKKAKTGDCETCGLWDSNLILGLCHVCYERYCL